MKSRIIRALGAVAATAALAACASSMPSPPSRVAQAPSRQDAAADHALAVQASAFESFMRRARGIDAAFSGPGEVAQALQTGAAHEPKELEAGMIAYAALAALQEPRFVAGLQAGRDHAELARRLAADPEAALDLPGGEAAGARAAGARYALGGALADEGQKVRKAAYSVQHQAWSKAPVSDPAGRLSRVKRISAQGYQPAREDVGRLSASLSQGERRAGAASPVVARGVALAALSVLGEGARGRALMSEPKSGMCLRMAKLNLYQCLASARPHYEDIFCLGQHAMIDPGQCVVDATRPARVIRRAALD